MPRAQPEAVLDLRDDVSPVAEELTTLVTRLSERLSPGSLRRILDRLLEISDEPGCFLRVVISDGERELILATRVARRVEGQEREVT